MAKNDTVTIREVYELIDRRMTSVNQSIKDLTQKFDNLEAGRLSTLEKELANMQGRAMMIPTIISIVLGAFFFLMNYIFSQFK